MHPQRWKLAQRPQKGQPFITIEAKTSGEKALYLYMRLRRSAATRAEMLHDTQMSERTVDRALVALRASGAIVEARSS